MSAEPTKAIRFLRIDDVLALTGYRSKSTLYAEIKKGEFPRGERLSHKMVVWPEPVIARWQYRRLPADLQELLG